MIFEQILDYCIHFEQIFDRLMQNSKYRSSKWFLIGVWWLIPGIVAPSRSLIVVWCLNRGIVAPSGFSMRVSCLNQGIVSPSLSLIGVWCIYLGIVAPRGFSGCSTPALRIYLFHYTYYRSL